MDKNSHRQRKMERSSSGWTRTAKDRERWNGLAVDGQEQPDREIWNGLAVDGQEQPKTENDGTV